MIRVVLFLVSAAIIASGVAWFADRPGDVSIVWLGYRIETSVMVATVAIILVVIVCIAAWSVVRAVLRSPDQVSMFFHHRRELRGYLAVTRGLIAVGAGDLKLARKSADEAARLSPGDPLALLLIAQSAQMAGDRSGAERAFRTMSMRDDTRLLGLRGLYVEAQRRNDTRAARLAIAEAAKQSPAPAWAGEAALEYLCAASDWAGAVQALDNMKSALPKAEYRDKRAVLLTARALGLEESDREASRAMALEAVKLAPGLIPAAALAGRRLAEAGEERKARKVLQAAWKLAPHPDIAEAYANMRSGDSARDRLARVQKLTGKTPGTLEGALAIARAALDARDFATARAMLTPYLEAPTRRTATLMAEIEEIEHDDEGRVREWMNRAMRASGDPAWVADGAVSERWLPVSPGGKIGGYEWKVPAADLGIARSVIEAAPPLPSRVRKAAEEPPAKPRRPQKASSKRAERAKPEAVIPLVHAPDDPGLDADMSEGIPQDPVPERSATPVSEAWQKLREFFR